MLFALSFFFHFYRTLGFFVGPKNENIFFIQGKGKKEKKKNKMLKLDSRILGFSVTAAQDRLNVGDRDYSYGEAP